MEMKENLKFQDDRDRQQTDVGSKKYPDNESVISCPGEAAGLLGCWALHFPHLSDIQPDLREMIVTVAWQYNGHTGSRIINVSLT